MMSRSNRPQVFGLVSISPATSGKQDTGNASLSSIQQSVAKIPANPATEGKQDTGNSSLATIAANTGAGNVSLTATPTVTAGAYTADMVVGGKIPFAGAARVAGGSGYIQQAFVAKAGNQPALMDLLVFHTDPTATFTDHAALPDLSADLGKLAGVIHCEDVIDLGTPKLVQSSNGLPFKLPSGVSTLYVVLVIRGSETYASTSAVTVGLGIAQD